MFMGQRSGELRRELLRDLILIDSVRISSSKKQIFGRTIGLALKHPMNSSALPDQLSEKYLDEYIGRRLMAAALVIILMNTIFVTLRYWSRYLQKAPFGWDDILILPSYISCLSPCICGIRENLTYP